MHRILSDRTGEQFPDRPLCSLLGIGGAHHITISGDGILTFQNLDDHRGGDHELDEFTEKRTGGMNRIEALGLGTRHLDAALSDNPQAGFFDNSIDGAGEIALGRIGLDD